jgi:predicted membrane-bound mannosyltransferase
MCPDEPERHGDWRLGEGEPAEPQRVTTPVPALPTPEPPHRLDRPLYVLTVEHLGWIIVALYAIATRLILLGLRPLGSEEARRALLELAVVRATPVPDASLAIHPSWIEIIERWIFAGVGANDTSARIVVAICGVILVMSALAMRRHLGRAGALALAAILALSPTAAYLARSGADSSAALAFMTLAIATALSIGVTQSIPRAALLGVIIALWLSAAPLGIVMAATLVIALVPIGIWTAIVTGNRWLRFRVWWERRRSVVLVAALVTVFVWYYLASAMLSRPALSGLVDDLGTIVTLHGWNFRAGIEYYVAAIGFYEFLIVILSIVGIVVTIVAARSRLSAFALIWAIINTALFLAMPVQRTDYLLAILLPPALVAAHGVDFLANIRAWPAARIAIAILGLATLYVGAMVNFIHAAADASQPPWRRHLLVYWSAPETTLQARHECERAVVTENPATTRVWVPPDAPQLAWYLSDLRPAESRDAATLVVEGVPANATSAAADSHRFAIEEWWPAKPSALTVASALRYLIDLRPWTQDVEFRDVQFVTQAPGAATAPSPAASATPLPSASATPSPAATPAASASATPLPTPTASPVPSASSSPAAEASPATGASPAASPSPESPAPSATPHSANL